jgi:hypothetical protein
MLESTKSISTKQNDNNTLLLSDLMHAQNEEDPERGAVLRWCINADCEDNISLELLSLPASLAAINGRPSFKRDTRPGQKLFGTMVS